MAPPVAPGSAPMPGHPARTDVPFLFSLAEDRRSLFRPTDFTALSSRGLAFFFFFYSTGQFHEETVSGIHLKTGFFTPFDRHSQ